MRNLILLMLLACAATAQSQTSTVVPKLVRFNGTFKPGPGRAAPSTESVTIAVYREQSGGAPLWQEVQNVEVDSEGRYTLLMGATLNEGMPIGLFTSGEPRWRGVQMNRPGEVEQDRVLLVSVPYALKAVDADTLGGKPASAYLLSGSGFTPNSAATSAPTSVASAPTTASTNAVKPRVSSGSPNFIGKFTNSTDLINSVMYENGGLIGVGTAQPAIGFDVRAGQFPQLGVAQTTDYLSFFASDQFGPAIYWDPAKDLRFGRGGSGLYNPFGFVEQMRIQSSTGNVGLGTMTPGSKLDVVGDINFTGKIRYQGSLALRLGGHNTALGSGALPRDIDFENDEENTALGFNALNANTFGFGNTAVGVVVLQSNDGGSSNTAIGHVALASNFQGDSNTAIGEGSLRNNTTGSNNIAIGSQAGAGAASGSSNNIHIGSLGVAGDSGTIRVGTLGEQISVFAAGIRGATTSHNDAIPVMIDSAGQLGTVSSSRRFKEDIADMGDASRGLMDLRPVIYRYKQPFADGSKPVQYGLIAEEVAEVYPDLVAHSADGQIETVKYQVLDSMLLNEVQRQQHEVQRQQSEIRELKERLAKLEAILTNR